MNKPHPNEIRNAQERQRLHCHKYGNAEPRPEDEELSRTEATCDWFDNVRYQPAPDELRDAWINDYDAGSGEGDDE